MSLSSLPNLVSKVGMKRHKVISNTALQQSAEHKDLKCYVGSEEVRQKKIGGLRVCTARTSLTR